MMARLQAARLALLKRLRGDPRCACGLLPAEHNRMGSVRQLLVDVSVIHRHDARTGIQRVVRALLLQLVGHRIEDYVIRPVFATASQGYRYARPDFLDAHADRDANDAIGIAEEPVRVNKGDIFLGLDLAANLLPRHQNQIRCWKTHGVSVHILVYDLLPIVQGRWFHRRTRQHFVRWLRFILRYADGVVCISEQVQSDFRVALAAHSGESRSIRINKIGLSGDVRGSAPSRGLPADASALCALLQTGPVALMVGTVEPRKGYDRALAAFERLWALEPAVPRRLVIAGKAGWKTQGLQRLLRNHPEAGKRLFWLENASDEYVELLYQKATGVLVTSHAEGYGLPLIEACAQGKPVLARDLAVFREFQHPGIQFFMDDRSQPLAERISAWLGSAGQVVALPGALPLPDWANARKELLQAIGVVIPPAPIDGAPAQDRIIRAAAR